MLTTPSAPATVETSVQTSTTETSPATSTSTPSQTNSTGSSAQNQGNSATPASAKVDVKVTVQKAKIPLNSIPLVLSLELIAKPQITQPNLFSEQSIAQEIPLLMLMNDKTLMEMLAIPLPSQTDKLNEIKDLTVEYEQ